MHLCEQFKLSQLRLFNNYFLITQCSWFEVHSERW